MLVAGCGALGSVLIDQLARAGVGSLVLVDRDIVEWTNLQRQTLYDERHARSGVPKAVAAAERVAAINSEVRVVAAVEDLGPRNAQRLAEGCDVLADGLDNFEARYLLNDLAVSEGLPYIYGGAVATTGMSLAVLPSARARRGSRGRVVWRESQATPCLRCLFPEAPPPGSTATCDTAGVLGGAVAMVATNQAVQIIKLLVGDVDSLERRMLSFDCWQNEWRWLDMSSAGPGPGCPCCGLGRFEHLLGDAGAGAGALCGRDAVQVTPVAAGPGRLDLAALEGRLRSHGTFARSPFLLRGVLREEQGELGPIELTLFADGRAIVRGTRQVERARSVYARYVGA